MDSESDDEFDIKTYSRRRSNSSVSSILRDVIAKCEKTKPQKINVISMAVQHQGNHRRLYELFNVLTFFGVTKTVGRGKLSWVGFHSLHYNLENAFFNIEDKSLTQSFQDIFIFNEIPSLGQVAQYILLLYPYLGVQTLDIKCVTKVLSMKVEDPKSAERKIYLAISILETIGCLEHHSRSGEYKTLIDIKKLIEKVQSKVISKEMSNPYSIASLLNHQSDTVMSSKLFERQREFHNLLNCGY